MEWVGETLFLSHNSIRNSGEIIGNLRWNLDLDSDCHSQNCLLFKLNSVFRPQPQSGTSPSCSQAGMPRVRRGQPTGVSLFHHPCPSSLGLSTLFPSWNPDLFRQLTSETLLQVFENKASETLLQVFVNIFPGKSEAQALIIQNLAYPL